MSIPQVAIARGARFPRWLNLVEPVCFAAFTAAYIWRLQNNAPRTWWLFAAWLLLSFALHRDTPKTLGWRVDNLYRAAKGAVPFFVVAVALLVVTGLFLGGRHRVPTHLLQAGRFWGYSAFCLLQQVALNSFVANRLLAAVRSPASAAVLSGAIFAVLHWPNPVLVPLTFVAGAAFAWLFARERNIFPLTVLQAVLGALVWWAFPVVWLHGMRVGPGFYTYRG